MSSIASIISQARHPQSAGGERLYKREAQKIVKAVLDDQWVSSKEAKAMKSVLDAGNITKSAVALLKETISKTGEHDAEATPKFALTTGTAADLATAYQRGDNPLSEVSVSDRKEILRDAVARIRSAEGRSGRARQTRSDAFTIAFAAMTSLPKARSTSRLIGDSLDSLIDAASSERHPRLQRSAMLYLLERCFPYP